MYIYCAIIIVIIIVLAALVYKYGRMSSPSEHLDAVSDYSNTVYGVTPRTNATAQSTRRRTY